jgi:hypothetical protein
MKLEFSGRILEKYLNFKFHEYLSSGSPVFPYGRMDRPTDRYKEANIRFSQFCERDYEGS